VFKRNYQHFGTCFCGAILVALLSSSVPALAAPAQISKPKLASSRGKVDGKKHQLAEKIFAEAEHLCSEGTADSCRLALAKYERALALWKTVDDREQQGTTLRRIGRIYSGLGDSKKALDYFMRSQKLCETFASVRCNLETRNELSPLYVVLGDVEKAWEQCDGALKLSRDSANRAGEAQALYNVGDVYYARGDQETAIEHFQQALSIWKELGDDKGLAQTFLYLGYCFSDLSNTQQAAHSYTQAFSLFEKVNDIRGRAQTLTAIGNLHNANGERQAALEYYDRSAPLFHRTGDRLEEARALNGMGFIYNKLGEPKRAIEYYQRARGLFRDLDYKNGESATLFLIGQVELAMGDHAAALRDLQQSLTIIRPVGDQRLEATLLSEIGMARTLSGDTSGAFEASRQALALNRKVKDRYRESYTLSNIAYLQERTGAKQQALESYNDALALSKAIGDRPGQSLMLFNVARVLRDLGNLDQARSNTEEALAINDTLRTKVAGDEMRALYSATVHQLYDFYVDLLMRLSKSRRDESLIVKAFEASERGRARSLLEMLSEGRENIREGVDATLLKREQDLQRRLRELTTQRIQLAEDETSTKKVTEIEKQLDELATEYQQVQGLIRSSSPRYAALVQPVPLSLQQVQQNVIDPETLLLEYSLGEERSYVWAITRDSMKSFELPPRAQIESLSRRAYELLTASNLSVRNETVPQRQARIRLAEEEFTRTSATLSQMILGPVGGELHQKRIVIVADGALQYLPFAALPSPVSSQSASNPAPLIAEHEIVLLPSASALWLMREELRGRRPAPKTVAILADAVFDKGDTRLAMLAKDGSRNRNKNSPELLAANVQTRAIRSFDGLGSGRGAFGRLPYSRREADAISALVPENDVMLALGFRANLATAMGQELSQYRYVHFATHGLLNSEQPELSGILLSSYDETGKRQNGFLQLHDVYNLKLSADLVVLSACETALGKDIRGEGLVGLTRGFMYAGVPRIVASLWNVDDAATAELMGMFYRAMLTEGKRPADALRTAQVHMWRTNQWSNPYYWAAFTLQGEWK
jgi:CHAT domain-containing protein